MKSNENPKRSYLRKRTLISLMGLALLSACSNTDFSDLEQTIAEIKALPKGKIDPLPPEKTTEPFSFEPDNGSRNPFKPVEKEPETSQQVSAESLVKPDLNRVKEDLESYPLDTLRMVGTLKDAAVLWALVQSNNGTIYRVKVGNYMGLNYGEITDISNKEIKLVEIVPDKEPNTWRKQDSALKLVETK